VKALFILYSVHFRLRLFHFDHDIVVLKTFSSSKKVFLNYDFTEPPSMAPAGSMKKQAGLAE
jgi:hypothetical protein